MQSPSDGSTFHLRFSETLCLQYLYLIVDYLLLEVEEVCMELQKDSLNLRERACPLAFYFNHAYHPYHFLLTHFYNILVTLSLWMDTVRDLGPGSPVTLEPWSLRNPGVLAPGAPAPGALAPGALAPEALEPCSPGAPLPGSLGTLAPWSPWTLEP